MHGLSDLMYQRYPHAAVRHLLARFSRYQIA